MASYPHLRSMHTFSIRLYDRGRKLLVIQFVLILGDQPRSSFSSRFLLPWSVEHSRCNGRHLCTRRVCFQVCLLAINIYSFIYRTLWRGNKGRKRCTSAGFYQFSGSLMLLFCNQIRQLSEGFAYFCCWHATISDALRNNWFTHAYTYMLIFNSIILVVRNASSMLTWAMDIGCLLFSQWQRVRRKELEHYQVLKSSSGSEAVENHQSCTKAEGLFIRCNFSFISPRYDSIHLK